jgi:Zn-dependent peptidase ImmA (M78 family)/transcriptional regulator with XRE-family HTH domain
MAALRQKVPFSKDVLRWARERRQRTIEEAASRVGTDPSNVVEWERGTKVPTVRQARQLAAFYERPFLEFLLDEPPALKESTLVPDLRMHRGASDPRETRELLDIQAWAEEQRLNALDLYETLGDAPPSVPAELRASPREDAEAAAIRVRAALDFPVGIQLGLRAAERDTFPKLFRRKLEGVGILVLKNTALNKVRARGLCLATFPLPVIVFGTEAPSAQAFTLAHELGHIVLRQSAISGPAGTRPETSAGKVVEDWCDSFAGAFLIPSEAISTLLQKPSSPWPEISDDTVRMVARSFAVSPHAMLIRMVRLGYVQASYYWERKRPQFIKEEEDYEPPPARPAYYGSRYRSDKGDLYTALVIEAWNTGLITNHNAAEFMGIKNLRHLDEIRDRFGLG